MNIVWSLIYLLLILGPVGLIVWQLVVRKDRKINRRVTWAASVIGAVIVIEAIFGKSDQQTLVVEKMAALSALISAFPVVAALILKFKSSRWVIVAFTVALFAMLIFLLAYGYRNLIEAFCHLLSQHCFNDVLMYMR